MAGEDKVQLLVFKLGGEEYGIKVDQARTIVDAADQEITSVPQTSEFIEGITNLRGEVVTIVDLRKRFELEKGGGGKRIIIVEVDENSFGLHVDQVEEVLRVPKEKMREPPEILEETIHSEYIVNVAVLEDRIIVQIDLKKAFTEEELERLSSLAEKGQEEEGKGGKKEDGEISDEEVERRLNKKFGSKS